MSPRGGSFQFERSVPKDIRHILGFDKWRESLWTDSKREAEHRCRKRTIETEEIIQQARSGTLRRFTDEDLQDLADRWSMEFQLAYEAEIAHELFPQYVPEGAPIQDDEPSKLFASRDELEKSVRIWSRNQKDTPSIGTLDWSKLIDECLDEYLVSNPNLPGDWRGVLEDRGFSPSILRQNEIRVAPRTHAVQKQNRLSHVFDEFVAENMSISSQTLEEYRLGVRRFIDLHGDMDVTKVSRQHVKEFRDAIRMLPSRPPNDIRQLSFKKQVEWSQTKKTKKIGQAAINKNLLGVKRTLEFGFLETAVFKNREWRNPFEGFSKKPGKPDDPIAPFLPLQLSRIFSRKTYQTKTVEKFWIPIVLFYTGARLDEISQLHVDDIKLEPVPHIVSENLEDENPELAKKLKTESSHRTIPLHDELVSLGFLEYAKAIKQQGSKHLFPNLPHGKANGRGDAVSRDFIRRFRRLGKEDSATELDTRSLVTHSLRHSFRTSALYLPDQMFVMITMGHYVAGESIQTYGRRAYLMPDLLYLKVMKDIQLPEIDLCFLREEANRYLETIKFGKVG